MSVALIIPQDFQPEFYLKWAMKISSARGQNLVVYDVRKSKKEVFETVDLGQESLSESGEVEEVAGIIQKAHTDAEPWLSDCKLKKVRLAEPVDPILADLLEVEAEFLILPRHRGSKSKSADFALQRELFLQAPCTTLQLCLGEGDPLACNRVVVPTRGSRNTADAIRLATDLAEDCDGQVEAIYLQEDVDESAALVGERTIRKLVHRYADDQEERVATRSLVCDEVISGIKDEANDRADLLILGASYHSIVHRFFFSS
ncbi:MAG: universal stress protein, partial [Lacipirellulaceae bacterium]